MPRDPYARAKARMWLKIPDEIARPALRQLSFEILYRPFLARMQPDELESLIARHPNPIRAQKFRSASTSARDDAAIDEATASDRALLSRMDSELKGNEWLAGPQYSLADVAMTPFVERLEHLGMWNLIGSCPEAARWSRDMMMQTTVIASCAPADYRLPLDRRQ